MSNLAHTDSMINEIRELLLNARQRVAVQVNTELLSTYWNVGKIIVEHKSLERGFLFPIYTICVCSICTIKNSRQCLENCLGRIIVSC